MARLKSCVYCGRIHSTDIVCARKPVKRTYKSNAGDLRNTYRWRKKREDIRQRDNYLCQVCIRGDYFNPEGRYKVKDIQVHHITPYKKNIELFYDDDNLICLCKFHHEKAEVGNISKGYLKDIAIKNGLK